MKKNRRRWIVGLVLVLLIGQLPVFRPARSVLGQLVVRPGRFFDQLGSRVVGAGQILFSINDLAKENSRISEENSQLQAKVAGLQAVQAENERLRQDLGFNQTRPDLQLQPSRIISFSPLNSYQSFMIDKGTDSGVKEGQAVVASGFLIGKIKSATFGSAEVALITNRDVAVPVILSSSQTVGILRGSIRGLLVETIPINTNVSPGELVVTSALEGLFPAGLAVGKVEEITSRKEEIFISLRVSSPVNIGNLSTVFVAKGK